MTEQPIKEMSFEQALAELEQVVNKLESGDTPLDKSIELYERGAALRTHCEAKLAAAEEKVSRITSDAAGNATGLAPADGTE